MRSPTLQSRFRRCRRYASLRTLVLVLFPLGLSPRAGARTVLANLTAGSAPKTAIVGGSVTHKVYVARTGAGSVWTLDAADAATERFSPRLSI